MTIVIRSSARFGYRARSWSTGMASSVRYSPSGFYSSHNCGCTCSMWVGCMFSWRPIS